MHKMQKRFLAACGVALLAGGSGFFAGFRAPQATAATACPPLLNRSMTGIDGKPRNLCQYAGRVVLVVNTASLCGYTPQYEQLQAIYKTYQARGFTVLGFPANDFGHQEPASNKEIASFCKDKYSVSFPMFAKTDVIGEHVNPLFAQLTQKTGDAPLWNFHKYLIDRQGKQILSFSSDTRPDDARVKQAIERMLAGK